MNIPVLILSGGLGTRLQHLIPDLPKPMANVAGKPFLYHLLKFLQTQGIKDVYLSVGYKSETIENYFHSYFHSIHIHYIKEAEPLGTGGAIAYALQHISSQKILILNGDTFLNLDITQLLLQHSDATFVMAVKYIQQSNRYGFVELNEKHIIGFSEKPLIPKSGWVNAGVYLLDKNFFFSNIPHQSKFSFETDFLEKIYLQHKIIAFPANNYFIDIGVPDDFHKAQDDFRKLRHLSINKNWTLFLDRDGVINKKLENDYVKKTDELVLIENVIDGLKILREQFGRIIIVTNQQGIGKGIMTESDLNTVHEYLLELLARENIFIDKIYYAPDLESKKSIMRKPQTGMALNAKKDFPDIQFYKSIMVGDSLSDLQFAHNAGMHAVYLSSHPATNLPYDFVFKDLFNFSQIFLK